MSSTVFDLGAFLTQNGASAPVLLDHIPNAIPKYTCTAVATEHGYCAVNGVGSVFLRDCKHFYSIKERVGEHSVFGYILSDAQVAAEKAWREAHPRLKLT